MADYTVDGTTLQANAPRHSAVWRKNSARYKQSAIERIEDYFDQIQALAMPLKGTKNYHYGPDAQTHDKCSGCPVKSDCTWDEGNRSIQFTRDLEEWKQLMTKRMSRGKAKWPSRNRGVAIESVFGLLKHNDGLRRLLMRGKPMVEVEVGLKSLAHNLRKMRTDILDGFKKHLLIAMSLQPAGQPT